MTTLDWLIIAAYFALLFGLAWWSSSGIRHRGRLLPRLVPDGMVGTWAPVKEPGRIAWYFNGNYPWLGMLFCAPIIGLWYWCTDQYIVQRALGAPNQAEARPTPELWPRPIECGRLHVTVRIHG
jgi:hypothetical protein